MTKILSLFAATMFLSLLAAIPGSAQPLMGISFPPVETREKMAFTLRQLPAIDVTHIRVAENWKNREPQRGAFNWAPLESRIGTLADAGIKVLLTVQSDGPDWACAVRNTKSCVFRNWDDFEPYLRELVERVGSRLDAIQFGNEWDHQFVGTAREYLSYQNRFYRLVKQINPDLDVVLGGVTSRAMLFQSICLEDTRLDTDQIRLVRDMDLNAFVQNEVCMRQRATYEADLRDVRMVLGSASYDIADLHLYDTPQLWPGFVRMLHQMTDRPVYITEFGGPNPELEPSDPQYQARRLEQYLQTISRLPVARAYFFKLTDGGGAYHDRSGLFDERGNPKPALEVFLNR